MAELAQAADAEAPRTVHTLLLPDHYQILDDGTVVFALKTGEQLSLTEDQYVLLDGGLLLVVDELAQNAMAELPVMGSLRTQLLTEIEPVRNAEGNIVEVSSSQPLWSGDGPTPRLFEELDLRAYEVAEAIEDDDEGLLLPIGLSAAPLVMFLLDRLMTGEQLTSPDPSYNSFAIRLDGKGNNGASGHSVSPAGDVDGDGKPDILIGAPYYFSYGETYLVFGKSLDGDGLDDYPLVLNGLDLGGLAGTYGIRLVGEGITNDYSGYSVSSAGDVDRDGKDDILIGAYGADVTYLVFGEALDGDGVDDIGLGPEGEVDLGSLGGTHGFRFDGGDDSGHSVSSAGDVDRDGKDDILIGAREADPNGRNDAGETYLIFGEALDGDGTEDINHTSGVVDLNSLDGTTGIRFDGRVSGDISGWSVSSAGDVNNDGKGDILIGAYNASSYAGETYLIFGEALDGDGTEDINHTSGVVDLNDVGGDYGFRLIGENGTASGVTVSSAGDIDGDGKADILIGAHAGSPSGILLAGSTYLVYGKSLDGDGNGDIGVSPVDLANLAGTYGIRLDGTATRDEAGWSVSSAGDVDDDGKDDILIGAYKADPNGSDEAGETYLVFGEALDGDGTNDAPLTAGTLNLGAIEGTYGVRLEGIGTASYSGQSVSPAGDIDGDGKDDILIGAWGADTLGRIGAGETYLISGHTIDLAADGIGVANAGVIDLAADLGLG